MLLCVLPKMMPCSIYLRSWILDLTSLSACECSSNRVRKPRKTGFVLPLSEVEHVFLCLQPPSWIANWGLVGLLRFFELEIELERSRWKKLSLGNGNFNFLLQMELSMSLFLYFVLTQWRSRRQVVGTGLSQCTVTLTWAAWRNMERLP